MANENHASYAKVGLTVVAGVAAIIGTLIYIGGVKDTGGEILIETCYDKPVSGLSVGSAVNFRGVKVGGDQLHRQPVQGEGGRQLPHLHPDGAQSAAAWHQDGRA